MTGHNQDPFMFPYDALYPTSSYLLFQSGFGGESRLSRTRLYVCMYVCMYVFTYIRFYPIMTTQNYLLILLLTNSNKSLNGVQKYQIWAEISSLIWKIHCTYVHPLLTDTTLFIYSNYNYTELLYDLYRWWSWAKSLYLRTFFTVFIQPLVLF